MCKLHVEQPYVDRINAGLSLQEYHLSPPNMNTFGLIPLSLLLCFSILPCLLASGTTNSPNLSVLWDAKTGPVYQDVKQRDWGDCWLDAAISSMAYANQDYLKEMIERDPTNNQTAFVYLYHKGQLQTVEVSRLDYYSIHSTTLYGRQD